jgi:hypothetical protein
MCYLINVSALGFDGNLPEHFRAYKLLASPTRNPTVLRTLGGVPYDITDGHYLTLPPRLRLRSIARPFNVVHFRKMPW